MPLRHRRGSVMSNPVGAVLPSRTRYDGSSSVMNPSEGSDQIAVAETPPLSEPSMSAEAPHRGEWPRHAIAEWTVTILLLLFGTTTLVQAFVIPTPSMEDTLLVGDHLLVDKLTYSPPGLFSKYLLPYEEPQRPRSPPRRPAPDHRIRATGPPRGPRRLRARVRSPERLPRSGRPPRSAPPPRPRRGAKSWPLPWPPRIRWTPPSGNARSATTVLATLVALESLT